MPRNDDDEKSNKTTTWEKRKKITRQKKTDGNNKRNRRELQKEINNKVVYKTKRLSTENDKFKKHNGRTRNPKYVERPFNGAEEHHEKE